MDERSSEPPERASALPQATARRRRRVWAWATLAAILAAVCLVALFWGVGRRPPKAVAAPPAVPVVATPVTQGDIGVFAEALGTVIPIATVSVTSRVQGEIVRVAYREGQLVRKGDPLVDIDPRPYQAALKQAEGQLAHDRALLAEARIDYARYQAAYARNAIAKQQLDDQEQTVRQDEGTVANDEGAVENARLNLAYCHITSPIDGRVGLRLVDAGNVVQANSTTALAVLTQLEPITVVFSMAEDYLPEIQKELGLGHRLPVTAFDRSAQRQIAVGALQSLDNQIDTTTGTIRLRALFPNADHALFPNQFVNSRMLIRTERGVLLVPTRAIQRNAQGAFVYVVTPTQTAALQRVTVGPTEGSMTGVTGIPRGTPVIVVGFDKVQDGVKVAVQAPAPGKAPA